MRPFAIAALGLCALPALLVAQYPTSPPPAGSLEPATFPPFQEDTLGNGMQLVLVQNDAQPVVSISLSIPTGSVHDPAGKEGLASMAAGLLTKGAGTRSANEISEAIERVGGSLSAGAGQDFIFVNADVLTPDAELAFELMADVIVRPLFPEQEVELARTQMLSGLELQLAQPASLASRFFDQYLYGAHPYARSATPATVRSLTREDLRAFQRTRLRPDGALLVVAGDLSMADARRLATEAFAGWTGEAPPSAAYPAPPTRSATEIVLVNRPGSVQANIVAGNITFGPADPLRYAATVANRVLGSAADSRLFAILREQKGWTYGAYSSLSRPRGIGTFEASTEVRTAVADSAVRELLVQLRRIGDEPVPAAEFEAAQGALVGSFPLTVQTAGQIAGAVAQAKRLGLGDDYVQTYRTRLAAVTPQQARAAAAAVVRPEQMLVVVVGDGPALYEKLAAIAPVKIISPQGDSLSPSDLTARAEAAAVDPALMLARSDSFAILVQGNPIGWQRLATEKSEDGWRIVEDVRIATAFNQNTTMLLDGDLAARQVTQTGVQQGRESKMEVTYAGGRVKGSSVGPQPPAGEIGTITIDTTVAPGAIDENSVVALLPALPWAPSATFSLQVFGSSDNTARTLTMTVAGTESVTVPAGTFEGYRVEVTGSRQPATIYITTAAPHRLLKMAPAGAPIEIVLVK